VQLVAGRDFPQGLPLHCSSALAAEPDPGPTELVCPHLGMLSSHHSNGSR
jgi:hypothetical protein